MSIKEEELSKLYESSIKQLGSMHDELIKSKDDTISLLEEENIFLKTALREIQEVYKEDREVIKVLQNQIKHLTHELEFVKRKYQLMWNQAIENYNTTKK